MLTKCIFHTNTLESRSALFDVAIRDYIHITQVDSRARDGHPYLRLVYATLLDYVRVDNMYIYNTAQTY